MLFFAHLYLSKLSVLHKVVRSVLEKSNKPAGTNFMEDQFNIDCLVWHNHYRTLHSAPCLQMDPRVS